MRAMMIPFYRVVVTVSFFFLFTCAVGANLEGARGVPVRTVEVVGVGFTGRMDAKEVPTAVAGIGIDEAGGRGVGAALTLAGGGGGAPNAFAPAFQPDTIPPPIEAAGLV